MAMKRGGAKILPGAAALTAATFGHFSPQALAEGLVAHQVASRMLTPEAMSKTAIALYNNRAIPAMAQALPYVGAGGLDAMLNYGSTNPGQTAVGALPPWIQNAIPPQLGGSNFRQQLIQAYGQKGSK
jgi:hypothetical protein